MTKQTDYSAYSRYATARQLEYIKAIEEEGSHGKAAKKLGVSKGTIGNSLKRLKSKAASKALDPDNGLNSPCPEAFNVTGLRFKDGKYLPAYAKPDPNHKLDSFLDQLQDRIKDFKPLKAVKPPKQSEEDLLNLYTISDAHLGMLAWGKESGEDWDLDLGYETLLGGFQELISVTPKSKQCLISQLGDFLHTDSLVPVTPASHHVLDTDTRYPKLVDRAVELMLQMISLALQKHDKVTVISAEGNHDSSAASWLQTLLHHLYSKESRVEIIRSPKPYYSYEFGVNMLGFHHGHKKKSPKDLATFFSADPAFREIWGRCEKTYIHTGHLHSYDVEEVGGAIVTRHPTLAPRDAYSSRGGWVSSRACVATTYHRNYGEKNNYFVRPEMYRG